MGTDPIEKKPLYHFYPGSEVFSLALFGCNFRCPFCQNAEIAFPEFRESRSSRTLSPDAAIREWESRGDPGIAFTYSEPTVWQDYLSAVAAGVKERGGWTVMVTNGYLTPEAIERLVPLVDAFNIDLKGSDAFYRRMCHARQEPVLEAIRTLVPLRHVEVTSLFIDGVHTDDEIDILGSELSTAGVSVWHISRFHPAFRMADHPATPESRLRDILERVRSSTDIPFIYGGNSRQLEYQQTRCPRCDTVVVERTPFALERNVLDAGRCPACGEPIYGQYLGT
jgi:pyruvate formate lyase activating enzyme